MIGVVERKGEQYASSRPLRGLGISEEDIVNGRELRRQIYSGVGNSGIFSLLEKYFADICKFRILASLT